MRSKKTRQAEKVAAITNMTVYEAKMDLKSVREEYGLGFNVYMENKLYELDDDERVEVIELLETVQEQKDEARQEKWDTATNIVAEGAEVSEEEARAMIKEAHDRLGIGPLTYARHEFYAIEKDQQAEKYQTILKRKKKNEESLKKHAREVSLVTSMNFEEAEAELKRVRRELGIRYRDYVEHRFYELSPEDQVKMANIVNRS